MLPAWSPPRPPTPPPSSVDTVATPPAPATAFLTDVVAQLFAIRTELADALWRIAPGSPAVSSTPQFVAAWQVKIGPGVVYGIDGFNANGSSRDIQFFDWRDTTVPVNGSIPFWFKEVATVTNFNQDWGIRGLRFEQGLWVAASSTRNTLTLGSVTDLFCTVRYL